MCILAKIPLQLMRVHKYFRHTAVRGSGCSVHIIDVRVLIGRGHVYLSPQRTQYKASVNESIQILKL